MVVNTCQVATQIDSENDLSSYANGDCADSSVAEANIESVRVVYKTVQKIFDPEFYAENQRMQSTVTVRGES